jgi:hypothetical protein
MDVTYKIHVDAVYYRTLIDRYYEQRPFGFRLPVQFGFLALVAAGLFFSAMDTSLGIKVAIAVIFAALIFFGGVAVTKWGIYQRFRYRADFGTDATVTISEMGLVADGRHVHGKWDWAAYPRAVRYPDGIMLSRRGVIRWLPDSAIVVGKPEDATALARSKSAIRELT